MLSFLILRVLSYHTFNTTSSSLLRLSCVGSLPPNTMSHTKLPVLQLYDKIFPSSWAVFLYHMNHLVLLHFNHLTWIQWFTSTISLLFSTMDPRYLNRVTCVVVWSPTFISKLEMLRFLLKLHPIYSILLLHRRKSHASKICLHSHI